MEVMAWLFVLFAVALIVYAVFFSPKLTGKARLHFIITNNQTGETREGDSPMAHKITAGTSFHVSVKGYDAFDNEAPIENSVFATSDEAKMTVTPDEGGAPGATFTSVGPAGVAQAQVSADLKVGEGENVAQGFLDVEIVAGEAVKLVITPDPV